MENLRAEFPIATLRTTLQLSDGTCNRFNITCLRNLRFWTYANMTAFHTLIDWHPWRRTYICALQELAAMAAK